jgi:WD40 repeat protein
VFGIGNHLDAVRSTRRFRVFCSGPCWVVLAVLVRYRSRVAAEAVPAVGLIKRRSVSMPVDDYFESRAQQLQRVTIDRMRRSGVGHAVPSRWLVLLVTVGLTGPCRREAAPPLRLPGVQPAVPSPVVIPAAPVPPPALTGTALVFADRRADFHLRHGNLLALGISRLGLIGATAGTDGTLAVWALRTGRQIGWITTLHGSVWAVAVTDDGSRLATGGPDGVRMWEVGSGTTLWSSNIDVDNLAFTRDGARLVGGRFGRHCLWDTRDGRLLWRQPTSDDPRVQTTVVANDGHVVFASYLLSGSLNAFDPDTGKELWGLRVPLAGAVAMSRNGDRIAVLGQSGLVIASDRGERLAEIPISGRGDTGVLLPDDPRYVVTWDDHTLYGWSIEAKRLLWKMPREDGQHGPQLAGRDAIAIGTGLACVARRLSDGTERWRRDGCTQAVPARASSEMLLMSGPSAFDVADTATGRSLLPAPAPQGPLGPVMALAAAPDGQRVIGVSADGSLWAWGPNMARQLVTNPQVFWPKRARFLPDGRLAVVGLIPGGFGAEIHRYGNDLDAIEETFPIPQRSYLGGAGMLAGERVIVDEVRRDDYLRTVIDLRGVTPPYHLPSWRRPPGHPDFSLRSETIEGAVANARLTRIYLSGDELHIHAWDVRSGRLVADTRRRFGMLPELALSADERYVIVGTDQGQVVLLEAETLVEVRRFAGPAQRIAMVASSPDSALVVAAAGDGLFAWRLADGTQVASVDFSGAHDAPTSIAFAPDGAILWVGTTLGSVYRFHARR